MTNKLGQHKPDVLYGVVVSDESAYLQLEKRNLPPSLFSKIFLEKEFKKQNGILENSYDYLDWLFENNQGFLERNYFSSEFANYTGDKPKKQFIESKGTESLDLILGTQLWRRMFLSGNSISEFFNLEKQDYQNYAKKNLKYSELEFNKSSMQNLLHSKDLRNDFNALLPKFVKEIYSECGAFRDLNPFMMRRKLMRKGRMKRKGGNLENMIEEEMLLEFEAIPVMAMAAPVLMGAPPENIALKIQEEQENSTKPAESFQTMQIHENDKTQAQNQKKREDPMDTIFFSSLNDGDSKIQFRLPTDISKFRITTFAVTKEGIYGLRTDYVYTQKPFSAQIEYPQYVYDFEKISLDITIYNNKNTESTVTSNILANSINISPNSLYRMKYSVLGSDLPMIFKFEDDQGGIESIKVAPQIRQGLLIDSSKTFLRKLL